MWFFIPLINNVEHIVVLGMFLAVLLVYCVINITKIYSTFGVQYFIVGAADHKPRARS
jgi:hypothetical protein